MASRIPVISGNVLKSRITARGRAERIPLQADIEIIATCNFDCVHCYIAPCAERSDVMSVDSARVIFQRLADAGTVTVLLTGGEILTHKQFDQIYLAAKRHGFTVYLNTNAYLIGERWASFFAEWPPALISISLYGMSDESYERLTRIPRAFGRVSRAIDLLLERGLKVELKCPAMTLTVDELPAMQAFAKSRGLSFRTDHNIMPQEKGAREPLQLQLSPKRVLEMQKQVDPGLEHYRQFAQSRVGFSNDSVYLCGAGKTALAINVFGGVSTCLTSRRVVGNILEQSFGEVWDALGGKTSIRYPSGHPCATCTFHSMCTGCPATVEALTGLPDGYVQQYCKMTHQVAYEMGYHPTGTPRTVTEGIPAHVRTPDSATARMLPVLTA